MPLPFKLLRSVLAFLCIILNLVLFAQQNRHMPFKHNGRQRAVQPSRTNSRQQMGEDDKGYLILASDNYETGIGEVKSLSVTGYYYGASSVCNGKVILVFPRYLKFESASTGVKLLGDTSISFDFSIEAAITNSFSQTIAFKVISLPGDTVPRISIKGRMESTLFTAAQTPVQTISWDLLRFEDPRGPTKGVKWLRIESAQFALEELSNQQGGVLAVDTSADGMSIYVAGNEFASSGSNGSYTGVGYVQKYTRDGLSIWERAYNIGSVSGNIVLKHTPDGGVVLMVIEEAPPKMEEIPGGGIRGIVQETIRLRKINATGQELWSTVLDTTSSTWYNTLSVTSNGSILATYSHTEYFDPMERGSGYDVVVKKLSPEGALLWSKALIGNGDDLAVCVKETTDGSILLAGATSSTTGDIDGYIGPEPMDYFHHENAFLLKLGNNGDKIWLKTIAVNNQDYFLNIHELADRYVVHGVVGVGGNLVDSLKNGAPLWSVDFDKNGNKLGGFIIPVYKGYEIEQGTVFSAIYETWRCGDGNYIGVGFSEDKFGAIKSYHGKTDILIAKITPVGSILWQKAIGGTAADYGRTMALDSKGDVIFGGSTESHDDDIYHNANPLGSSMVIGKLGITNTVKGRVFIDNNGNQQKDANEPYYNEGRIYTVKGSDTTIARIFNGQFLTNVDTGNYVTTYASSNDYFTISPARKTSNFTSFDQEDSLDFALVPQPNIKDLQVSLTPLTPARPGFEGSYRIITKNVGTATIANAVISFKKDSRQTYTAASRTRSGISADSIWWGPRSLASFQSDTLDITLTNAVPPGLQNGDTLTLMAYSLPLTGDTTAANNIASFKQVVQGSYDPNDKTEAHAGIYTPAMQASKEPFQYLIRFQNTGTDTAFFITVKDTLDERVSLSSLETITTSHPYRFSMNGRIASWQFDKILLVDSLTNEPKSHGYISFTIQPSASLQVGDSVTNKAAIYFDFNLPIITNEALVAMISAGCPKGNTWTGIVSTAWENPNNWSCGSIPTETTDVLIKAGTPHQPVVNSSTKVNSITAGMGAQLMVKAGVVLEVKGK